MELSQDVRSFPTRAVALVMAFLAVLALGLTVRYVLASHAPTTVVTSQTTSGFPGPDAKDRNDQLNNAKYKNSETHGH